MRLNQYLAAAGLGSRRACEQLIRDGLVEVAGQTGELATRVEPGQRVTVRGRPVFVERAMTVALYKPAGVVCSHDPQNERKRTVYDLLPKDFPRLVSAGRLDEDSEGLLILSNQGELVQKLTHPRHKLPKVYRVKIDRDFDEGDARKLKEGFLIEPGRAQCDAVFHCGRRELEIVLRQGLKRQIRLMLSRLGYHVNRLKRIRIGSLDLKGVGVGHWRILTQREITERLLREPPPRRPPASKGKKETQRARSKKVIKRPQRRKSQAKSGSRRR